MAEQWFEELFADSVGYHVDIFTANYLNKHVKQDHAWQDHLHRRIQYVFGQTCNFTKVVLQPHPVEGP